MILAIAVRLTLILSSSLFTTEAAPMYGRGGRALVSAYGHVNQAQQQQHFQEHEYQQTPGQEYDDYHGQYHVPTGLVDRFRNALNVRSYGHLYQEEDPGLEQPLMNYNEHRRSRVHPHEHGQQAYSAHDSAPYQPPPVTSHAHQKAVGYLAYDPRVYQQSNAHAYHQQSASNVYPSNSQSYPTRETYYSNQAQGYQGDYTEEDYAPGYNDVYYAEDDEGYTPSGHGEVYTYDYPCRGHQDAYYGHGAVHDSQAHDPQAYDSSYSDQRIARDYTPQAFNQWQMSTFPQEEFENWQGPEYDESLYPKEGDDDIYWQPYGQASYDLPDYGEEWRKANPEEHHEEDYYIERQRERLANATIEGATYVLDENDNDDDNLFPVNGGIVEVRYKDGTVNRVEILNGEGKRHGIKHDFSEENPISWWKYMSGKEDRKAAVRKVRSLTGYDTWWWKKIYAKNKVMVNMVQSDAIQLLDKHGYKSTLEQKRAIARGILKNKIKHPILPVPKYNPNRAWYEDTQKWETPEED